jgi:hypothetical protein
MSFLRTFKENCLTLSLNCREAARAQSEQLEHPLPRIKRIGLWLHLLMCKWCRRYGKQIRFLRQAAHEHQEKLLTASSKQLSDDARERIKRSLQSSKKS